MIIKIAKVMTSRSKLKFRESGGTPASRKLLRSLVGVGKGAFYRVYDGFCPENVR